MMIEQLKYLPNQFGFTSVYMQAWTYVFDGQN